MSHVVPQMIHLQSQAANQQLLVCIVRAYNIIIVKDPQKIKTRKQLSC